MATKPALADRQIAVGGTTYTLRFSVRAMGALQDHFGLKSLNQVGQRLQQMGDDMGVEDLAAVLWAGLRSHHPDTTKDDALGILDDAGLNGLDDIIGEAFQAAAPDDVGGDGAAPDRPTKPGRSTASSKKARRSA
jgi:hypothetical protein